MATRPGRSVRVDSCASAAMPVPEQPQVAILAEGQLERRTAKTAIGVIRYAPYPVVAIVDSTRAGTAAAAIGAGRGIPIVASVEEATRLGADVVLIGTAAPGGRIADADRPHLRRA